MTCWHDDALGVPHATLTQACQEKTFIRFDIDSNDARLTAEKDLVGVDRFVKDTLKRPITRDIIGGDLPEDEEAADLMCNPAFNATPAPAPLDAVSPRILTEATKPGPSNASGLTAAAGSLRAPSCAVLPKGGAPRAATTKSPTAPSSSAAGKPHAPASKAKAANTSKAKQAAAPRKPPVKPQPAPAAKASGAPTGSPTTARQPANTTARQTTNSQEPPGCIVGSWGSDGHRVRAGGSALPKPKSLGQPKIPVGRARGSSSSSSLLLLSSSHSASKRAAAASPGCSSESTASRQSTDSWGSRRSSQSSSCSCSTGGGSGSTVTGRVGAAGGSSKKRVSPPVAALQRPKIAVGRFSLVNPVAGPAAVSSRAKGSLRGSRACAASLAELDGAWMWICNVDGSMRSGKAVL
jgi:hypothetical protein